jgi:hypothetical protein
MMGMFGKNRDKFTKIFSWVVGVIVIGSMVGAYFASLFV